MHRTLATLLLVLLAVAACSTSPGAGSASTVCTSDSSCTGGLKCIGLATFQSDGGCTESGKQCSTACSTDADCASLGAKYKCFAGCGATKSCGATP